MSPRLTRQEALAKGEAKCYGSFCKKHPELEGFRWVSGACVQCARDNLNNSRKNNPEKTKANNLKYYKKRVENSELLAKKREADREYGKQNRRAIYARQKEWLAKNPLKTKEYAARNRKNNPGAKNAETAKRRSAKLLRTPKWLTEDDLWIIKEAYSLAVLRTKMFGFVWHVDHVIPLQGKSVSGLHVPQNLQVVPAKYNISKGNKLQVRIGVN